MGVVASQRRKSPKKLQRERRIGGSLDVDDLSRVVCYVDLWRMRAGSCGTPESENLRENNVLFVSEISSSNS